MVGSNQQDRHTRSRLIGGAVLIALGLVLLLEPLGLTDIEFRDLLRHWPLWLIGVGMFQLATSQPADRPGSVWLIVIGGWFLLNRWASLEARDTWPLILAAGGAMMVWEALSRRSVTRRPQEHDSAR